MKLLESKLITLLVIPLMVGGILMVAQFWLKTYTKEERVVLANIEGPFAMFQINELLNKANISYSIEYKTEYQVPLSESAGSAPKSDPRQVVGESTPKGKKIPKPTTNSSLTISTTVSGKDLQIFRITIKNIGTLPVRALPVRLVFKKVTKDFRILHIKHESKPPYEFGEIQDNVTEPGNVRIVYSLLNPDDIDSITVLVNERAELEVYAKSEGVSFSVNRETDTDDFLDYPIFLLAAISALLALTIKQLSLLLGINVEVLCHRGHFFSNQDEEYYFIKVINLSPFREVEITHVWIDDVNQIHVLTRPLPIRLKYLESWETWIELDQLPKPLPANIFDLARIRLSTGRTIQSREHKAVPNTGYVSGVSSSLGGNCT